MSQNLEKDIQKYFVITRQLKLENIEPVACFSECIHAYLSNRLLSIIQSHPPPWFIHPMEFLSINKTPTKMTRQWLCHLVEPKDGVLPPRSSTTTADNQRAYIHNTTQKARQFWWRKSPSSAQLFIRPFGWRKYYSNIYWSLYTALFKALKLQNLGDTNGGSNEILLSFLKHFNITFNLPGGWWLRKFFINSIHPYPPCKTVHFWMIKSRAQHTTASSKEVHNVQFKWFSCSIVLSLAIFSCLATSLWYSRLIKHI